MFLKENNIKTEKIAIKYEKLTKEFKTENQIQQEIIPEVDATLSPIEYINETGENDILATELAHIDENLTLEKIQQAPPVIIEQENEIKENKEDN